MSDPLVAQLVRDEGEVLTAYEDTEGVTTIGVGHNLQFPISQMASRKILADDIATHDAELYEREPWIERLDTVRQGVLRNMAFALGVTGLLEFDTFVNLVSQGQWQAAANDLLATKWAGEVGDRAKRLAQQLITGVWQ